MDYAIFTVYIYISSSVVNLFSFLYLCVSLIDYTYVVNT